MALVSKTGVKLHSLTKMLKNLPECAGGYISTK